MSSSDPAADGPAPGSRSRNVTRAANRAADQRLRGPVAGLLRRAALIALTVSLMGPVQAAAAAIAIAGWVATPAAPLRQTLLAALVFAVLGVVRALLDHRAGGLLFAAADQTMARERAALIAREISAPGDGPGGSAALAALVAQKLPMLGPWLTRYHVAMLRVRVVPLVLVALAAVLSWPVALIFVLTLPLIPLFMALVGMGAEAAARRQTDEIGTMNGLLAERLAALTDIRLLGAADRAAEEFATRAEALRAKTMEVLRLAFLSSAVLELFAAIGVAMVAVFVGFSLLGEIGFGSWGRPLTLAQGLFLLLIAPEVYQPLRDLAAAWHDRASGLAVVAEIEALEAAPRVPLLGAGGGAAPLPGPLALRLSGAVAALPGRDLALPDLTLAAGQSLALTGPSGAGKSTALRAIAGLVPLAAGRIEVCGVALDADTADAWRGRIALIPQGVHFADTTLADWLDPAGRGADPWPALDLAGAGPVVRRLPGGLGARLGETGAGVSGGEARRLLVARAVLAGGDLVLADEPTADLDRETAQGVIAALRALQAGGRALLVATHDPALAAALDARVEIGR